LQLAPTTNDAVTSVRYWQPTEIKHPQRTVKGEGHTTYQLNSWSESFNSCSLSVVVLALWQRVSV